jgi:hypothetical protein
VEAWQTGNRPAHLDQCELCLDRTVELTRWLDEVRHIAVAEADAAFPPERLAAQQAQILRRLEQLDRPARLIAFPNARPAQHDVAAGTHWHRWVVAAAAAGLIVGVLTDHVTMRLADHAQQAAALRRQAAATDASRASDDDLFSVDFAARPRFEALGPIDDMTPRASQVEPIKVSSNR